MIIFFKRFVRSEFPIVFFFKNMVLVLAWARCSAVVFVLFLFPFFLEKCL